jgi:hypothetical protein
MHSNIKKILLLLGISAILHPNNSAAMNLLDDFDHQDSPLDEQEEEAHAEEEEAHAEEEEARAEEEEARAEEEERAREEEERAREEAQNKETQAQRLQKISENNKNLALLTKLIQKVDNSPFILRDKKSKIKEHIKEGFNNKTPDDKKEEFCDEVGKFLDSFDSLFRNKNEFDLFTKKLYEKTKSNRSFNLYHAFSVLNRDVTNVKGREKIKQARNLLRAIIQDVLDTKKSNAPSINYNKIIWGAAWDTSSPRGSSILSSKSYKKSYNRGYSRGYSRGSRKQRGRAWQGRKTLGLDPKETGHTNRWTLEQDTTGQAETKELTHTASKKFRGKI